MSDSNVERGFTHVLMDDVQENHRRFIDKDTPTHRRDLVRAIFSGVEGMLWDFKKFVADHSRSLATLSPHEHAALLEESYSVDDRGNVKAQPRFLPTAVAVRLVVSIVQRCRPEYGVDFDHPGWGKLKRAVAVRNRIVHPKRTQDQNVTDDEISDCLGGFMWMLALAVEIRSEIKEHYEQVAKDIGRKRGGVGLSDAKTQNR